MTTSNPGVPERDPRSCFQILSLDGGGLRGLFSSAVLAELESDLGMSMVDHFDLIVGTSTGGLVALGLGAGRRPGELVEFYVTDGPRVFKGGRGRIRNARRPKHSPTALRAALEAVFGDRTLGSSARPLVVPAYSLDTQDVYLFKTDHHPRLTSSWRGDRWSTWRWPLPPRRRSFPRFQSCVNHRLIDGGVWANNPTLVGVVEAVSMFQVALPEIRVLSLGTTDEATHLGATLERGVGSAGAGEAHHALLRAQDLGTFHAAEHLIGPEQIVRINTVVPKGLFHARSCRPRRDSWAR